ncbi:hypothetical protein [Azospirillum picis]|uniref:Uncharacterized protein n=1 Tax=Azospirillum picis TaxID=488438 RepID=A0ABU0MIZ6_9PROT|nr:hypothetical protein [Azospirillum picis]MBP2299436.1 hypothetical protein [Azospirillum picis]MDQ0533437.1 hypothetical protein [Azospirillum picis]
MIETQALLFLALTGMIGHAVYMASGRGGFTLIRPEKEETDEEPGVLFSSERLQQTPKSDKAADRPFWIE